MAGSGLHGLQFEDALHRFHRVAVALQTNMYYGFQAIRAAIIMQICWCAIIKVFVHCPWTYAGGLAVLIPLTADQVYNH